MVSSEILKKEGLKSINEYFKYILKSLTNGQRKQVITLAEQLSIAQKVDAIEYLEDYTSKQALECRSIILNTI
ncbi:MAG: hypothetical protein ACWIPI_10170 [Polaribacter sp.]